MECICVKTNYNLKNKLNCSSKYTIIAYLDTLKNRYTENNVSISCCGIRKNLEVRVKVGESSDI